MRKPKRPKPKQPPPKPALPEQHVPRRELPTESPESSLRKLLAHWRTILLSVAGTLGVLYSFADGVREIYFRTFPELHVGAPDYSAPFSLPFSIRNPSSWFDMKDVSFSCRAQWIDLPPAKPDWTSGVGGAVKSIGPGETKRYSCAIVAPAQHATFLNAELTVAYRTLFRERTPAVLTVKWQAGFWVERDIAE
jgi:hypothetical protein